MMDDKGLWKKKQADLKAIPIFLPIFVVRTAERNQKALREKARSAEKRSASDRFMELKRKKDRKQQIIETIRLWLKRIG